MGRYSRESGSCARTRPAYDALYLALAEALDAPLVTTDHRLSRVSGHRADIDVVR